jgi:GT2 family glycosyltransferase
MLLDVIYVNYKSTKGLIKSIESLNNKNSVKYNLHIIVVDNSSEEDNRRVKDLIPGIKLIRNKKNVGFGAAINQALKYCFSKYIILLNPDTLVIDGFIEASIRFIDQNDNIGILGPMIFDEDGGVQGSARSFPTILTSLFGRNSPITKIFPKIPLLAQTY